MSSYPKSLLSGPIGAVVVTALNESVRRIYRPAPRLEKLGMDTAAKTLRAGGIAVPPKEPLFWGTMAADLVSNALYYSLINFARRRKGTKWIFGAGMGLAAGLGAVALPEPLNLYAATTSRSIQTKVMTVTWYLTGALVTTAIVSLFTRGNQQQG